jgi:DNA-binding transcriptional regulator YdaS (Cro superfamily)
MIKTNMRGRPQGSKPTKKGIASVNKAIRYFGEFDKDLANALGVSNRLVCKWRLGQICVSLRCAKLIEKKTKGEVKASSLSVNII